MNWKSTHLCCSKVQKLTRNVYKICLPIKYGVTKPSYSFKFQDGYRWKWRVSVSMMNVESLCVNAWNRERNRLIFGSARDCCSVVKKKKFSACQVFHRCHHLHGNVLGDCRDHTRFFFVIMTFFQFLKNDSNSNMKNACENLCCKMFALLLSLGYFSLLFQYPWSNVFNRCILYAVSTTQKSKRKTLRVECVSNTDLN